MAEQPAGKMLTAAIAAVYAWPEAKELSPALYDDLVRRVAGLLDSEALKLRREAYQECAAKACGEIGCFEGVHQTNNPHAKWLCPAYKIFAAIALLDLEIAKGAAK